MKNGKESNTYDVDVFFIAPTVYGGDEEHFNMDLQDEETKAKFVGATYMEKGIYDENRNFYAPFYRQKSLSTYKDQVVNRNLTERLLMKMSAKPLNTI